jgi:hypothetical protein
VIDIRGYDERARSEVLATIAALETSDEPIPESSYLALRDHALREMVRQILAEAGRCRLELDNGRWSSGYRDNIADELSAKAIGQLAPTDRAVLALVLLHSVAIPRAAGRITSPDWTVSEAVDRTVLHQCKAIANGQIDRSIRRLQARGILRRGHGAEIRPGPQFQRLTECRSRTLWEDLVLLCKPSGAQAAQIERRRTRGREQRQ